MYHSSFNHSYTEEHLGCFQFGTIKNKAAKHVCILLLYEHKSSFLRDQFLRVQVLRHNSCRFNLLRNYQTVFKLSVILHSHQQYLMTQFLCILFSMLTFPIHEYSMSLYLLGFLLYLHLYSSQISLCI